MDATRTTPGLDPRGEPRGDPGAGRPAASRDADASGCWPALRDRGGELGR